MVIVTRINLQNASQGPSFESIQSLYNKYAAFDLHDKTLSIMTCNSSSGKGSPHSVKLILINEEAISLLEIPEDLREQPF